jgi:UDP-N-acetylmuramate: L-alanyl-gamma-D-glutamyl-meso-diaminopimelate ligase
VIGEVKWNMTGQHSVANALATIAAAQHVGVTLNKPVKPYPTSVALNAVWSC